MELPQDPAILEFYEEFVDTWISDINEQWDAFIETKNVEDFYRFAHTLKGSGYQFSITPLGDAGIELMLLIKDQRWNDISPYKEKLLSVLQEAKQLYMDSLK